MLSHPRRGAGPAGWTREVPWHEHPAPSERHPGDSQLLPDEHRSDLLLRPHRLQPPRYRPMGAQFPLRRVLRLVGRRAPPGLHPAQQTVRRVRQQRADRQLPPSRPGGAGLPRVARGAATGGDGVLRRGDRGDLPGAGLRPDPPVRRPASPARLQDRHHSARQRGGGAQRAERPGGDRLVEHLGSRRHRRRTGHGPRRPDALRRLRQDHVLHQDRRRLDGQRGRHRRPAGQGHEADQQQGGRSRGCAHPPRAPSSVPS